MSSLEVGQYEEASLQSDLLAAGQPQLALGLLVKVSQNVSPPLLVQVAGKVIHIVPGDHDLVEG